MEQFCRICFNIYPEAALCNAKVCWEYFEKIAGMYLDASECSFLCRICVHKIRKFLRFRDVVHLSDVIFKRIQKKMPTGDGTKFNRSDFSLEHMQLVNTLSTSKILQIELSGDLNNAQTENGRFEDVIPELPDLKTEFKSEDDFGAHFDSDVFYAESTVGIKNDPIGVSGEDRDDLADSFVPLSPKRKSSRYHSERSSGKPRKAKRPKPADDKYRLVLLTRDEQIAEMRSQAAKKRYIFAAFKCERCFSSFAAETMYLLHNSRHENVTGHFCDVCHCYFRSSHHLYQHTNLVHKKRYQCSLCDFRRKDRALIEEHYNLEHGGLKNNISCGVCGKAFRKQSSLKRHVCNQEKVKCEMCDKFLTKLSLKQHILNHVTSEKRYECSACDSRFFRLYNLQAHEKLKHSSSRGEFYCSECDVSFKSEDILKRHLTEATRHATEENLKPCPLCPAKLPKWGVKAHVNKEHLNLRQYKCDSCPKDFFNRNSLVLHRRRTHEGIQVKRKYVCETCGKSFTTKQILIDHSHMHSGLRPYRCKYCDADFGHKASRYNHMRLVHLKVKLKPQGKKKRPPVVEETEPN